MDFRAKTVHLSSILDWFGADFGGSDRKKLDYAARWVQDPAVKAFLTRRDLTIRYATYDWGINTQKPAKPAKRR